MLDLTLTLITILLLVVNIYANIKAAKAMETWQALTRRAVGASSSKPVAYAGSARLFAATAKNRDEKSVVLMTDYRDQRILNEDFEAAAGKPTEEEGPTRE